MLTAILSYILPSKVFVILAGASGFTAMFNWLTICITHFFYRKKTLREKPEKLKFKVVGYTYTTVLAGVLIIICICHISFVSGTGVRPDRKHYSFFRIAYNIPSTEIDKSKTLDLPVNCPSLFNLRRIRMQPSHDGG
jgi:amino acid permease